MTDTVKITSGSDATLQFAFKNEAGGPLEVSSPVILLAEGPLSGRLTPFVIDGPSGIVDVVIEGTAPIPPGNYGMRLQVVLSDSTTLASERVVVNVR